MLILKKALAEAATKLARDERRRWVQLGMHTVRRPGRRWKAALTPRQIAAAKDQVAITRRRWQESVRTAGRNA